MPPVGSCSTFRLHAMVEHRKTGHGPNVRTIRAAQEEAPPAPRQATEYGGQGFPDAAGARNRAWTSPKPEIRPSRAVRPGRAHAKTRWPRWWRGQASSSENRAILHKSAEKCPAGLRANAPKRTSDAAETYAMWLVAHAARLRCAAKNRVAGPALRIAAPNRMP
jgi:hypothetical protein